MPALPSGPTGFPWRNLGITLLTSHHSALGRSPFEALYGYTPRHFGISALDSVDMPELSNWLRDRQVMADLIHQHFSCAKERMKRHADKKHSERQF